MPFGERITTTGETPAWLLGPTAPSSVIANVDDWGNVLTPGSSTEEQDRRDLAMRLREQGQFEFQRAVANGVAPEEAFRQSMPKMFYGEPDKLIKAMDIRGIQGHPSAPGLSAPQMVDVGQGARAMRTGPNSWDYIPPRLPDSVKIEQDLIKSELGAERRKMTDAIAKTMDRLADPAIANKIVTESADKIKSLEDRMRKLGIQAPSEPSTPTPLKSQTEMFQTPEGGFEIRRVAQTPPPPPAEAPTARPLTESDARSILREAGGDKEKARKIARERGYTF